MALYGFCRLDMNGKKASLYFNPGWGEIPEWYITLGRGVTRIITDGEEFQDELDAFVHVGVSDGLIENDWITLTNFQGAVRILMEYVEYNADNELDDIAIISTFREGIVEELRSLTSDVEKSESVDSTLKRLNDQASNISGSKDDIKFIEARLAVAVDIEEGVESGLRWNNASFARLLKDRRDANPHDRMVVQAMSILEQYYPGFLVHVEK